MQSLPLGDADAEKWINELFSAYIPEYFDMERINLQTIFHMLLIGPPSTMSMNDLWGVADGASHPISKRLQPAPFSVLSVEEVSIALSAAANRSLILSGGSERCVGALVGACPHPTRASFLVDVLSSLLDSLSEHMEFVLARCALASRRSL